MVDLSIHHVCGLDELRNAPLAEADRIVSILAPSAATPIELLTLDKPILTLRFDDVVHPEPGVVPPAEEHVRALLAFDAGAGAEDRLVVHCAAGISRSTAALAIVLAARHPQLDDEIFTAIRELRPLAWPNARLITLGDVVLERRGALVAALQRHCAIQRARFPGLA